MERTEWCLAWLYEVIFLLLCHGLYDFHSDSICNLTMSLGIQVYLAQWDVFWHSDTKAACKCCAMWTISIFWENPLMFLNQCFPLFPPLQLSKMKFMAFKISSILYFLLNQDFCRSVVSIDFSRNVTCFLAFTFIVEWFAWWKCKSNFLEEFCFCISRLYRVVGSPHIYLRQIMPKSKLGFYLFHRRVVQIG